MVVVVMVVVSRKSETDVKTVRVCFVLATVFEWEKKSKTYHFLAITIISKTFG